MIRKNQAESLRRKRKILKIRRHQLRKEEDYGEVLANTIPAIRNDYAHPHMHTIVMPQEALFQLRISAELINQLFADSAKATTP